MPQVFTVGHGARSFEELAAVLRGAGIDVVIDVRRFPGSRRHPQFGRAALEKTLPAAGLRYEWWGETLGGRRTANPESPHTAWTTDAFRGYADHMGSEEFTHALRALEDRASDERQAVMCAETLWWKCHRRLIADALVAHGFDVVHLGLGRDARHRLSDAARIADDGSLIYDVGPVPLPGV